MAKEKDAGVYHGRLSCDGEGNLLAYEATRVGTKTIAITDEEGAPVLDGEGQQQVVEVPIFKFGPNHGKPVAAHEGSYVFVSDGERSHNDRHHERFLDVKSTAQAIAEGVDDDTVAHDAEPLEDDPHFKESATNARGRVTHTRAKTDRDSVAVTITGHTDAYTGA